MVIILKSGKKLKVSDTIKVKGSPAGMKEALSYLASKVVPETDGYQISFAIVEDENGNLICGIYRFQAWYSPSTGKMFKTEEMLIGRIIGIVSEDDEIYGDADVEFHLTKFMDGGGFALTVTKPEWNQTYLIPR